MRTRILLASVTAGLAAAVFAAEPPALLNYEGVLRDASDAPLSGAYDMTFRFYNAATGGGQILVDEHTLATSGQVTASGGLFNVQLGGGTVTDGAEPGTYTSLSEVFRDYEPVWLEIQIGAEILVPRVRIVSSAYALNAGHLSGRAWTAFAATAHQHPGADITSAVSNSNMLGGQASAFYLNTSSTAQTKTGRLVVTSSSPSPSSTGRVENSAGSGDVLQAVNTMTAGTSTGRGVVGQTAQSSGVGIQGSNTHTNGTGVAGSGNNLAPTFLVAGSGGAFRGNTTGLFAEASSPGTAEAIYTNQFGNIVRVNHFNGAQQYKILGTGTVSSTLEDQDGRRVTVHAPEAPEILLMDVGQGRLVGGFAHIELDPIFAKNVAIDAAHPLRVFVQLEDSAESSGVAVKNKAASGFDVVELGGGKSNAPFQWQVLCNRADENLPFGRISRNADARFEPAPPDAQILTQETVAFAQPRAQEEQALIGDGKVPDHRAGVAPGSTGSEDEAASSTIAEPPAGAAAWDVADVASGRAALFSAAGDVETGDVLVLDLRRPGLVRRADHSQDAMIVGIAAGRPSREHDDMQVSVTGSGFALIKADAASGPILPGDLLTLSATPGHVGRALPARPPDVALADAGVLGPSVDTSPAASPVMAAGSPPAVVIGRALEALESGRGLIKALVTIQ